MAAYFFASPVDVDVKLEGEEIRKQVDVKQEKERTISCPVYYDGDSIGGTVRPFVLDKLELSNPCARDSLSF